MNAYPEPYEFLTVKYLYIGFIHSLTLIRLNLPIEFQASLFIYFNLLKP